MIGDYVTIKTLGTGAFGTVMLAKRNNSENLVAIKSISKHSILRSKMGTQVKKEISIIKALDHPNIVQVFEVLMSTQYLYIVMDFAPGGELYGKITRTGRLSDEECRRYVRQLCSALEYCHGKNVCHRDIKPENILLDKDDDNALLADFGFASIMQAEESDEFETRMEGTSKMMKEMSTMCGTMAYMAPEILHRDKYLGDKVDIWALGVVIYVLLVGFMPFKDQDVAKSKYMIPRNIKSEAADFLSKMLIVNPRERFSARRLLEHPWVAEQPESFRTTRLETSETVDSEDMSDDEVVNLDFSVTVDKHKVEDTKLLKSVQDCMNKEGWRTRQMGGSLKASRLSSAGVVMVAVKVNNNKIDVRHANLSKDGNVNVMKELKSVIVDLSENL